MRASLHRSAFLLFHLLTVPFIAQGAAIAVPNYSFETPVFSDGTGIAYPSTGVFSSWRFIRGASGHIGFYNPADNTFLNTTGSVLPSPAEGNQYGEISISAFNTASISTANPVATIAENTRYTLTVAAGNEHSSSSSLGILQISLEANTETLCLSSIVYQSFPLDSFSDVTASVDILTGSPHVGRPLNVRISFIDNSSFGDRAVFDNVRLDASPSPLPEPNTASCLLVSLSLLLRRGGRLNQPAS
jgi:hypothetical protein